MESYAHETGMAKQRMDSKRRLELFHRISRIVVDDAASMPLYQQLDLCGVNKRLVWKARGDERILFPHHLECLGRIGTVELVRVVNAKPQWRSAPVL
jgi:hypothetical protein